METKSRKQSFFKEWLEKLQQESWQLELLISGLALFGVWEAMKLLNRFRQDNGYADGSYRKLWNGREDNEHLMDIVATLPASTPDYPDVLYAALSQRYAAGAPGVADTA